MTKTFYFPSRRVGLERSTVSQGLSAPDLGRIESLTRLVRVEANYPLLEQDEIGDSIYFVLSGTVCIQRIQSDATRLIFNLIGATEMLGEVCALDNQGHSACATTSEVCVLLKMRRGDFQNLEDSLPMLARNVKILLSRRLRFATTLQEILSTRSARCRIARLLVALAERYAQNSSQNRVAIPLRLPQKDVADWVGISRQHAEKHLLHFRAEGLLQIETRRRIVVLDRQRLVCYCDW